MIDGSIDNKITPKQLEEEYTYFPSCRLEGTAHELMRTGAVFSLKYSNAYVYHKSIFKKVSQEKFNSTMAIKFTDFYFGEAMDHYNFIEKISSFDPSASGDMSHLRGSDYNISISSSLVFDLEIFGVSLSLENEEGTLKQKASFQYTSIEASHLSSETEPLMQLRFRFVPFRRVYSIGRPSFRNIIIDILAIIGGVFGVAQAGIALLGV